MKFGNREVRVALIVATGFIGCADGSASGSNEKLGAVSQAWGTAACSTANADTSLSVKINPFLSGSGYATCKKSYVVDLFSYGETPSGSGGGPPDGGSAGSSSGSLGEPNLTVRWGDSLPTTQVECEASWVGGIFYQGATTDGGITGNGPYTWSNPTGQVIRNGVWSNGECQFPPVVYEPLAIGEAYRVAATARTSSDQTRSVSIRTGDPDVP